MFWPAMLFAQDLQRTISGTIDFNDLPFEKAEIWWISNTDSIQSEIGEEGNFVQALPMNRYQVVVLINQERVLHLGQVLINKHEPAFLNFDIPEGMKAGDIQFLNKNLSGKSMRIQTDILSDYAGLLDDPGRIANMSPSVNTTNDQNNGVSVRGNSPNYNRWRIEGVEIVNPNHQFNTGTFTDQPVWQGGTMNIIHQEFFQNASFNYGLSDAAYVNAIAGTFDFQLRQDYREKSARLVEAGLLGLKYAQQQRLGKQGGGIHASYRGNPFGMAPFVDFGLLEDQTAYHDLNISATLPVFSQGTLKLFGLGGQHTRDFKGINEIANWDRMKDRSDYNFKGLMGAVGASLDLPIANNLAVKGAVAYSGRQEIRKEIQRDPTGFPGARADDDYTEKLFSGRLSINWKLPFGNLTAGVQQNNYDYNVQNTVLRVLYRNLRNTRFNQQHSLTTVFGDMDIRLGQLTLSTGLQFNQQDLNNNSSLDPRVRLSYTWNGNQELFAGYGNYSQVMSPFVYYSLRNAEVTDGYLYPNEAFGMLRTEKAGLGYINHFNAQTSIRTEAYWQRFNSLPVSINSDFGVTDFLNESAWYRLTPQGQSSLYGMELLVERSFFEQWYLVAGFNWMGSRYDALRKENLRLRFDNGYSVKVHMGKEFYQRRDRVFTASLRAVWQGGTRSTRLELEQGPFLLVPRFRGDANAFQFSYYNRIDVRLKWDRMHDNMSTAVILDIINITNRDNTGFLFFDEVQQAISNRTQLGFMPVLTYQVRF